MLSWTEKHFERGRQQGRVEGKAEGRAEGQAQGRAEGQAQGRAEGKAEALLQLLSARGVHVNDKARHRILSCTDIATLDQWFQRALRATRLADVLDEPGAT